MSELSYTEFAKNVRNANKPRKTKISGSYGVYDVYRWLRKNKWFDIGRPLKEHEFYSIIRRVNNYYADEFLSSGKMVFPQHMGNLELRKYPVEYKIDKGKVKTNLRIDWDATLKLWYEDEESYKKKTLVKMEEKERFRVIYNKGLAFYTNQNFMNFTLNRDIKMELPKRIRNGLDAFRLW